MCVCLWITSFLLELPNFLGWGDHVYDQKTLSCVWDRTANYSYTVFFCCVGIVTPITLISICYLKIFLYVHASKKRLSQSGDDCSNPVDSQSMKRMGESMRLARTLFSIFVVFVCCWTPYAIIIVSDKDDAWPTEIHLFSVLFAHCNSSVNCLLYGLTNSHFRKGYATLLNIPKMKRHGSQQRLTTCDDDGEDNNVLELENNTTGEHLEEARTASFVI